MTAVKREPALVVGVLVSVLTLVGQVLSGEVTWVAAVPLIASAVTRFFVSPATDVVPPAPATWVTVSNPATGVSATSDGRSLILNEPDPEPAPAPDPPLKPAPKLKTKKKAAPAKSAAKKTKP